MSTCEKRKYPLRLLFDSVVYDAEHRNRRVIHSINVQSERREYRAYRHANILLHRLGSLFSFYGLIAYKKENTKLINQVESFTIDALMKFIHVTCHRQLYD